MYCTRPDLTNGRNVYSLGNMNLAANQTRRQCEGNSDGPTVNSSNRFALTVVTSRASAGRARTHTLRPLANIVVYPGTTTVISTIASHQKPGTFTSTQQLGNDAPRQILFLLI